MKKILFLFVFLLIFSESSRAADYKIDFGLILDFEDLRPLIDLCLDLGILEHNRETLESTGDLESLRELLEDIGLGEFSDCPDGVSGDGIREMSD